MTSLVYPLGAWPFLAPPSDLVPVEPVPVLRPLAGAAPVDSCYAIEIAAYGGSGIDAPPVPEPLLAYPLLASATPFPAGGVRDLRYSDRGMTTAPDDVPANIYFDSRLTDPFSAVRAVPLTPELGGSAAAQIGIVSFANADGALDSIADLAVDARRVRIKRGRLGDPYADYATLFDGQGLRWERDSGELRLIVRARDYVLERPLQSDLYEGTGSAEGGPDLAGKPKPQCYGVCPQVRAVPVDANALTYQVHDRAVESIDAVYDRAQALNFAADYASYASLAAATIAPGYYATCKALGYFRLGGTPAGIVTADIRGDAPASLGGYTSNAAQIARRLMTDKGGLAEGDLDSDGIALTAFRVPGAGGWYFDQPTTIAAAIDDICASAWLWWAARRDGKFTIRRLRPPSAPEFDIAFADLVAPIEAIALPDTVAPCNWRRRVNYARCWTPQTGTEIDNALLDPAMRAFVGAEWRTAFAADAARRTRNVLAVDPPPVDGWFRVKNDADALAVNLLSFWTASRRAWRVPVRAPAEGVDLDICCRVTAPMPAGFAAGLNLRVYGLDERHRDGRIDLLCVG